LKTAKERFAFVDRGLGLLIRQIGTERAGGGPGQFGDSRLQEDCDQSGVRDSRRIERGINSPSIRVVVKIAAVLKVPPSRIVPIGDQDPGLRRNDTVNEVMLQNGHFVAYRNVA